MKAKANSKGDLKDLANCCNVLGELFQQQGKYEEAILEHEASFKYLTQLCVILNSTTDNFLGGTGHLQEDK